MPPADDRSPGKDPSRPSAREPLTPRPAPASTPTPRPTGPYGGRGTARGGPQPLVPRTQAEAQRAAGPAAPPASTPPATPATPKQRTPEQAARAQARDAKREARREAWRRRVEPVRKRAQRAWSRARNEGRGVWKRTANYRALRDVLGALLLVGAVLGGLSLATGGAWPPLLVIESGSMMHPAFDTHYGRLGTIDVGDIIFMRDVDDPLEDVELWVDGGKEHYGRPGDVIVYAGNGNRTNTSIVHRAITYVQVERLDGGGIEYTFRWIDGETKRFGREGIYFPALGFDENFGFTPQNGYRPSHSGFLTKGDNYYSNPAVDQALRISGVVEPSWVDGTVHGEIPWIGLGRLALQNGQTNPAVPGWERIGNAFAPVELWSMFFVTLGLLIVVPLSIDTHRLWRRERMRRQLLLAQADLDRGRGPERRAATEFTPVLRASRGGTRSGTGAGPRSGGVGRGSGSGPGAGGEGGGGFDPAGGPRRS